MRARAREAFCYPRKGQSLRGEREDGMKQNRTTDALSPKQLTFLRELLGAPTIEAAATQANVAHSTAHRWLKEPAFVSAYRTARRELLSATTSRLQRAAIKAAETLETLAVDATTHPAVRVSACKAILDSAWRSTEQEDVVARLEAIEQRFAEEEGRPEPV